MASASSSSTSTSCRQGPRATTWLPAARARSTSAIPPMWASGRETYQTSSGPRPRRARTARALASKLRRVSATARAVPPVPDVRRMATTSSGLDPGSGPSEGTTRWMSADACPPAPGGRSPDGRAPSASTKTRGFPPLVASSAAPRAASRWAGAHSTTAGRATAMASLSSRAAKAGWNGASAAPARGAAYMAVTASGPAGASIPTTSPGRTPSAISRRASRSAATSRSR